MSIKKRETNYDLLRILCCLGVILVHSNIYYEFICNLEYGSATTILNRTDTFHIIFSYFFMIVFILQFHVL